MSKKIIIGANGSSSIGLDADLLLAGRLLITADSGGGKSWALRVLLEQAFGKIQTITLDPEGEFASLREKYPFVLAGKGGDTPVDIRSAGMLAHRLLKLRVSAVCDLYELRASERHAWVKAFLHALIEAPKELRTPLLLCMDELHMFAPEKGQGESEARQEVIDVATRGRKRGICLVGITQRLAMLDKNVTSQLQNRLVGAQFEEVNIKTAVRLLGIQPGKEEREFHKQIQQMDPGFFFALGRAISKERILVAVRDVETSHPKAFQKHTAPLPPTPEKIKHLLPQLADLPKEAEDKVRSETEMRKEIRLLKDKLSVAEKAQERASSKVSVSSPVDAAASRLQSQTIRNLHSFLEEAMKVLAKINAIGFDEAAIQPEEIRAALEKGIAEVARAAGQKIETRKREFMSLKAEADRLISKLQAALADTARPITVAVDIVQNEAVTVRPTRPREHISSAVASDSGLSRPQLLLLQSLREMEAIGRTVVSRSWLAFVAGVSSKSSGFEKNISTLSSHQMIRYPKPGTVSLTDEGRSLTRDVDVPITSRDLLNRVSQIISGPQAKLLEVLYEKHPGSLSRAELAQEANVSENSSGFEKNVSTLSSRELITYPVPGQVRCSDWLFF